MAKKPLHRFLEFDGPLNGFEIAESESGDDVDWFVVHKGKRIAKRGKPDSVHAKQWVSIEPGFVVRDTHGGNAIEVEYVGSLLQ
jgi:hypothetical protein